MKDTITRAIRRNLDWFRNSGVMDPADGSWGVAERIAVTDGNSALEKMLESFPAWTMKDDHCIIEQRRSDCNFQTATLFQLAAEKLNDPDAKTIAENIFNFLYCRSGLLFTIDIGNVPAGVWQWSHIRQRPVIWFDDNSWCILLQLALYRHNEALREKFRCKERALQLAKVLVAGAERSFANLNPEDPEYCDPENVWFGNIRLPHWGALTCMALASAYEISPEAEYADFIHSYLKFVDENLSLWNVSELCYALLGASFAFKHLKEDVFKDYVLRLEKILLGRQDTVIGNFPSEHEKEAPVGIDKVDTIYTANWAFLALQCSFAITGSKECADAKQRLLGLLLRIQDKSDLPQYSGCWRGMYDLESESWGGGDCFEGGASSIYTGWTNAPISLGLIFELDNKSLLDL